jgi:hypothetical protein
MEINTKKVVAKHFDDGKPDLSLIPYAAEVAMAQAFMYGSKKYGRYNYCSGHDLSKLIASAKRHISKFYAGEDNDNESGVHHLGHAMVNLAMILQELDLGTLIDDRYKPAPKLYTVDEKTGVAEAVNIPYYYGSEGSLYTPTGIKK